MEQYAIIARDEEGCWVELEAVAPNTFCLFEWFEDVHPGWKILSYAIKDSSEDLSSKED